MLDVHAFFKLRQDTLGLGLESGDLTIVFFRGQSKLDLLELALGLLLFGDDGFGLVHAGPRRNHFRLQLLVLKNGSRELHQRIHPGIRSGNAL